MAYFIIFRLTIICFFKNGNVIFFVVFFIINSIESSFKSPYLLINSHQYPRMYRLNTMNQNSKHRHHRQPVSLIGTSQFKISIMTLSVLSLIMLLFYSISIDTMIGTKLFMGDSGTDPLFSNLYTQSTLDTHLSHIFPQQGEHGNDIPKPTDILSNNDNVVPILKPTIGTHRPYQDAIFAIGDGLSIQHFVLFLSTLRNTGFDGDVVFTFNSQVSHDFKNDDDNDNATMNTTTTTTSLAWEYLILQPDVVIYENVVIPDKRDSSIFHLDETNVTNVYLHGLYGAKKGRNNNSRIKKQSANSSIENENEIELHENKEEDRMEHRVYHDPRPARSLGIARFELYWVWSQQYNPQSRILLIDAKDTYFQPFSETGIGTGRKCKESAPSTLHLYEENKKVVKLGSLPNRAQLIEAYKDKRIMWFLHNLNVLTPASTHGSQKAIEAYTRAMVHQFDDTGCTHYQCEWAFHNYIYYFGILMSMEGIDAIKTHLHGTGAVHSIGYNLPTNGTNQMEAFDDETFDNETLAVLNGGIGHKKHSSWAVHQYDRHPLISKAVDALVNNLMVDLQQNTVNITMNNTALQQKLEPIQSSSLYLIENDDNTHTIRTKPFMGVHRPNADAIFSFIEGNFDDMAMFILSARKSGFDGDIVVNISAKENMEEGILKFLKFHSSNGRGVVVYEGYNIFFEQGDYQFRLEMDGIAYDVAKFEYFYVWSHNYIGTQIMIIDGDVAYFQSNPFEEPTDCGQMALHFYAEHKFSINFDYMYLDKKHIWNKFLQLFDMDAQSFHAKFKEELVLNPTAFFGDLEVLQRYLTQLIDLLVVTKCIGYGCDFAGVNYMWYKEIMENGSSISVNLSTHYQGSHSINPGIAASLRFLEKRNLFDHETKLYLNWDGKPSPVILNYYLNTDLNRVFDERLEELLKEFPYE